MLRLVFSVFEPTQLRQQQLRPQTALFEVAGRTFGQANCQRFWPSRGLGLWAGTGFGARGSGNPTNRELTRNRRVGARGHDPHESFSLVSPYSSVSEPRGDSPIHNGKRNPSTWARQNLTMRMQMRRFTRLTNGFSKKVENLRAAVSLHFAHDNFVRQHKSLRITSASGGRRV